MESRDFSTAELTARESSSQNFSPNPSGRRKQRPELDWVRSAADAFAGVPDGMRLKEAVYLLKRPGVAASAGLLRNRDAAIALLDYWLCFVRESDCQADSRPLVWLSVSRTAKDLDWSPRKVQECENALRQIGAYVPRDSANLHRDGERDADGRIILEKTYGQDLSPLVFLIGKLRQFDAEIAEAQAKHDTLAKDCSAAMSKARAGIRQGIYSGMLTLDEGAVLHARLPDRYRPTGRTSLEAIRARLRDIDERRHKVRSVEAELQQLRGERMLFDPDAWPSYADTRHAPSETASERPDDPLSNRGPAPLDAKTCSLGCESPQGAIESYSESVGLYLRAQGAGLEERAARPSPQPEQRRQAEPPAASAPEASPAAAHTPKADGSKDGEPQASTQADRPADELPDPKDEEAARAWWKRATPFTRKWHVGQAEKNRRLDDFNWNELDDPESRLALPAWAELCRLERMRAEKRRAEAPVLEDAEGLTWARLTRALPRAIRSRVPEETSLPHDPSMLVQAARSSLAAVRIRPEDWDRACSIMGAPKAALCITVMAAKQETDEPIRAPGRYLAEMSRRDRLGELNLAQTLQAIVRRCERTGAGRSAFRKERPHV